MQRFSNLPADEVARLQALRKLKILDSPYETLFDHITRATGEICKTPIALISFVDEDRQWFKAKVGIDGINETPRELAFCADTILTPDVLEIPDTHHDDRYKDNPLVTGYPHIRFYAGAPIALPLGERIGSLCVIDTKPNALNEYQKAALQGLAKVISHALLIRDTNSRVHKG